MHSQIQTIVKTQIVATLTVICMLTSIPVLSDSRISMDGMMMKLAVENNDAAAQYFIGRNFLVGKSVQVNKSEAAKWFLKSANQDYTKAQYELARLYLAGDGVKKNSVFAFDLMFSAAKNDHSEAQYELAKMYLQGFSGPSNPGKAIEWLNKAADGNHSSAMFTLGKLYYEGKLVTKKRNIGLELLKEADYLGSSEANKYLKALSS